MSDSSENKNVSGEEASTAPAAAPAPVVSSGGGGGAVFFAVFLSVAASGAMVVGSPYWTPFVEKVAEKIIELPNPLKRVEQETARLARAVADLDGKAAATGADSAKLKEQVSATVTASAGVKAATLALAGSQLRARLTSGEPFEFELAAVRAVAKGDAEINGLLDSVAKFASSGAHTRAALRETFPRTVAAVVAAEAETAAKSAAGWLGGLSALADQLGYVMQVKTAPEGGVHATVRQARARLSAGDIVGAADELATLPAPRAAEADEWLEAARGRAAADKADGALTTLILARLAASK
jgi:hypothetical protein